MKNTVILLFGFFAAGRLTAQYRPIDQGSEVKFTVSNFGFGVDGVFKGLQGNIDFDTGSPAAGHFDVSVDAGMVNTDNGLRDGHLRNEGYFDVKDYPRIRLVSTKIVAAGPPGAYGFFGELTIRGVTREVSFPFTVNATGEGLIFKGAFTIRRKDFGVGGASTIANELTVSLRVVATK